MLPVADAFEHEYRGCEALYGRGRASDLGTALGERGVDRALVVCGSNVGGNDDLMDPIREGLGDRLAGVFDGTTPAKRAATAYEVLDELAERDADALVAVGGGSSLDVARQATVLDADGRDLADLRAEAEREGSVSTLTGEPEIPVAVVPTTFAGADLSDSGSLVVLSAAESPTGQPVTASGSAMPVVDLADPALFETTPRSALAGSAMNGFDKGIETPYASGAEPVGDATAVHGLRLLSDALPVVAGEDGGAGDGDASGADRDPAAAMDRAVVGALLVQMGRKINVIHAFGHGFARRYDVQQGAVHAAVAPAVLRYLFDEVDASRRALAAGLGIDGATDPARDDDAIAADVVDAVAEVRDALPVPERIRDLPETREADLPAVAEFIAEDHSMAQAPTGIDGSAERIEAVLRDAW